MHRLDSCRREPLDRSGAGSQIRTATVLVLLLACCCGASAHPVVDEAGFDDGAAVHVTNVPVRLRRVDLARASFPTRPVFLTREMTLMPGETGSSPLEQENANLKEEVAALKQRLAAVESVPKDSELAVFVAAQNPRYANKGHEPPQPSLKCCWACGEKGTTCGAEGDPRRTKPLSAAEKKKEKRFIGKVFPEDLMCCSACGFKNVRCSGDSGGVL